MSFSGNFTSESVTEGHPDKICDQLADAVLDAILKQDKYARVACEALVTTGLVLIAGEITTKAYVDITSIVRSTIEGIGYTDPAISFDAHSCAVMVMLEEQSPDIAIAIDRKGAGDQGMMIGYATNESLSIDYNAEYMPLPIFLANLLTKRLARVRKDNTLSYLYPDGKSQVTVEYNKGRPTKILHAVISAHHKEGTPQSKIRDDIISTVIEPVLEPTGLLDPKITVYHVNPTGSFARGGPLVDVGVTGRKIVVDTYGTMSRHGGAAFSGKDPTKTDRSANYAARWIAKNIIAAGLADRCEIQLAYIIGEPEPVSVNVDSFGTGAIPDPEIVKLVLEEFDLTPAGILEVLDLRRPIYSKTAAYGHFGRTEPEFTWEVLDKVEDLKRGA
ncbi:MAG: methionine adenosyltransferase [Candidatus Glassbacteria bacterium]